MNVGITVVKVGPFKMKFRHRNKGHIKSRSLITVLHVQGSPKKFFQAGCYNRISMPIFSLLTIGLGGIPTFAKFIINSYLKNAQTSARASVGAQVLCAHMSARKCPYTGSGT
jgi:hypothetical protein